MLFIISNSDGDTTVRMVDEAIFLEELNKGEYGLNPRFLTGTELMEQSDTNYWTEGALLVLRGGVIIPSAVRVISEWGLPK